MNTGKTLFAQLMDFVPWSTFNRLVGRYGGDQRVRTLACAEPYRAMAFAQLDASLTLLQILSLTLFEKMLILQALSQEPTPNRRPGRKQPVESIQQLAGQQCSTTSKPKVSRWRPRT